MSDTNTHVPDAVLARLRKLMAVANAGSRGATEGEMNNATSLAQEIAARYNLELAQIENETQAVPGGKREKTTHDRAAMYGYQRSLMTRVASVHFCRHFIVEVDAMSNGKQRRVKRHVLLGRDVNVKSCLIMYDYLVETLDRLLPYQGMQKRGREALLWLEGASDRIGERLNAKRRAMEEESRRKRDEAQANATTTSSTPGTALVLSDVYSTEEDYNTDFEYGLEPGTTARKRKEAEARNAAWQAEYREKEAKRRATIALLVSQGIKQDVAYTMVHQGIGQAEAIVLLEERRERYRKDAEAQAKKMGKPETEAQKEARERRERAEATRQWHRDRKRNVKYYDPNYRAGVETGDKIGLDDQVTETVKARLS